MPEERNQYDDLSIDVNTDSDSGTVTSIGKIDKSEYDLNGDGKIDKKEMKIHTTKIKTQRSIAITAMVIMCAVTIYLLVFMPVDRLAAVSNILDMFYITMGGVIATYMGVEAYITKRH